MGKSRTQSAYAKVIQEKQRRGEPAAADGHDQVEAPSAPRKKGRDPKMNGHTIYFHDEEFELIVVEAMRRKQTISEYVVWGLRAAPHKLLSVQKDTTPRARPAPQGEQPPSEAPDDDQAGAPLANANGHG